MILRRYAILDYTDTTQTHTNTNTVVGLAPAGNGDQTGLALGAGLASWGQAN